MKIVCTKEQQNYLQHQFMKMPNFKQECGFIDWKIIEDASSSCYNCWASEWRDRCVKCLNKDSKYYGRDIKDIQKEVKLCDKYGAYEGDG